MRERARRHVYKEVEDSASNAAAMLAFAAPNFASHDSEDDAASPRGFGAHGVDAARRGAGVVEGASSPSLIGALALGENGAPPQRRRGKILSTQPPASSRTAPWATECV